MSRYEQPSYSVISSGSTYEVRRYESYLAAETVVSGSYDGTGNQAFRRLAGFIFGGNSQGVRMKMTIPVTHEQIADGSHRYRFVMQKAYSEASSPRPLDDTVEVVSVPAGYYAALRYRGNRTETRFRRVEAALRAALERDGVEATGGAFNAVYDGPFVPPPLRRNEVLIPIAGPAIRAA